ncbi:glucan biosynthesis protein [uncultured Paracoccus sp.]|uniref:glucan biosynthesis protein n=1 Tax=uncultured Paracoccus sp. TaxID=189685 RepID=UPI00260DA9D4|nr:glucan biosynthesis protein G [uncultured Paracoccus sp.]
MKRRVFVGSLAAAAIGTTALRPGVLGAQSVAPPADQPAPDLPLPGFGFDTVVGFARELAQQEHVPLTSTLDVPFKDLGYDAYRGIRFRREADPWQDLPGWGLDLLPPGMLYTDPVRISLVDQGVVRPLPFDPSVLTYDANAFPADAAQQPPGDMGWSGFRLRTVLNRPGTLDELAVFQGASYFRALGRGNRYGLSARGLALGTGTAEGEEFPRFREFWIHTPDPTAGTVTVHALLDSPSVAGAFEYVIAPGDDTVFACRTALFPRRDLADVGVAPLTSMFWFGPADDAAQDDYRPAVHDSDGLQMITGAGQRLWRVLNNPPTLQISSFIDSDPRAFGLMQRGRDFRIYQDAEAAYQLRPSAWVTPRGSWGDGSVTLVEIPVESEFHDNIVAFWTPAQPLLAGEQASFDYDIRFGFSPADAGPFAQVRQTMVGRAVNTKGAHTFVVDFDAAAFDSETEPQPVVTASEGRIEHPYLIRLSAERLIRLAFEFLPDGAELADLTARLDGPDGPHSETWMFRWVRD